MARAVRIHAHGGPEVLKLEEVEAGNPGFGEVLIRQDAIGVNFIDVYHRTGLYPQKLPCGLGVEAAGRVEAVGPGVVELRPGDRVGYVTRDPGAYADLRVVREEICVKLPDDIGEQLAAAALLKGMTAECLLRRAYVVRPGDTVLFHAAAGGTGLLACQWAAHLGARVIGTVSTREKAELARAHGCEHVVVTSEEDFVARVRDLTSGQGCQVVYDSVGRDTFQRSLECLALRGTLVSFGQSSGPVPPFDVLTLAKGGWYLTRPSLFVYNAKRADLVQSARALFEAIESGALKPQIAHAYRLEDAAQAHRDLEARKTKGAFILIP